MKKWLRLGCYIYLLLLPLYAIAADNIHNIQRRGFLAALSNLAQHRQAQFLGIAKHLQTYPLYPYLVYADLATHLTQASPEQIQAFLNTYQDTPLASHMRILWLNQLLTQQNWQTFLQVYQPSKNINLQCAQRQALWKTGKTAQAVENISGLLDKSIIPKSCLWVLSQAAASGRLGQQVLWSRIQWAFENNNIDLANQISAFLPADQKNSFIFWRETAENPLLMMNTALLNNTQALRDNILLTGIQKAAHKNPRLAAEMWIKLASQLQVLPETQTKITQTIASGLADAHEPIAEKWFAAIPEAAQDTALQKQHIRFALWQQNWPAVQKTIQSLPREDRKASIWRYWLARALEAQGDSNTAKNIYQALALQGDFYGQLSDIQLGQPPLTGIAALKVSPQQITAMASLPVMQRASELYQLQWLPEANQEWQWAIEHMPAEDYLAAAELAIHWGWFERAIATVNLINNGANIPLRFPLTYREPILAVAQKNQLNPAWIFALIRQESLFAPYARSSAGAVGLMQLLPSTANSLANQLHLDFSPQNLTDAKTNLYLGSMFLKQAAIKFNNNEVLATAAYNAGPGRVKKWLPATSMPADIWIENIPYHQTRQYVKNIMASITFYEKELGLPFSLEQRVKPLL